MFSIVFAYLFHSVPIRHLQLNQLDGWQSKPNLDADVVMPDPVMKAILIGELDIFCCILLFAMFASRGDLFFHFRGS